MNDVKVSIICTAYNHENYIRDALESFVNQNTTFKYEVIIHDDASTDNTAKIIREYEEKYPEIIKSIYQEENQYSKRGTFFMQEYMYPLIRGAYVAFCEGDDYWLDNNKLQKQFDFMEANPEYSACVHAVENVEKASESNCDLLIRDIICYGGKIYQTSSLFCRNKYLFELPEFVSSIKTVLDYPLAIYLRIQGKIRYLSETMSYYRVATPGSWTVQVSRDPEKWIVTADEIISMLKEADVFSDGQYSQYFEEAIDRYNLSKLLVLQENKKAMKMNFYQKLPKKEKVKIALKAYCPFFIKIKKLIKGNGK